MIDLDAIERRASRRSDSFADREEFERHARTDVPALIARVRELEAELVRFHDWYRNAFGGSSKRETPWDPCACEECESLRRLKGEP